MFRFAHSVGSVVLFCGLAQAAAPAVSNTHPQGQERSPIERDTFAPMPGPASLGDVAPPARGGQPKEGCAALAIAEWLQHFQRPLGLANPHWLARR